MPPQIFKDHDSQDLLLGHGYPDLSAQLDLWTNLAFDSEEPLGHRADDRKSNKSSNEEEEEEARSPVTGETAVRDGHVNVVTPANVAINQGNNSGSAPPIFDLNAFLAGFGIDAYSSQQQPTTIAPSLAQLLALHPNHNTSFAHAGLPQYTPLAADETVSRPAHTNNTQESSIPAKRARTRKESITNLESPADYREESVDPNEDAAPSGNPLSAAEDKRRRNTAASARFRLKKKEREAALEGRAKELETKVNELERECEGLRRENGWLKGLVVGVTGAAQGPGASQSLVPSPPSGPLSSGTKRRREEAESA
ncbi:hypothetical protein B0H34DRAFT_672837 [Crassisporium funariophilum]|nr:hypothetical protein B0H34DRAFT_672837 [Crassisporium funariophilum]